MAPLLVFAYNRPEHFRAVLNSLLCNPEASQTQLHIFSDGPKSLADADAVAKVRGIARKIVGFAEVQIFEQEENRGLAASIISGISLTLQRHDRVIVLEDDIIVSPCFLRYMNEALRIYANHPQVACISGYVYPIKRRLPNTFFIRGADCWGWATWRRAWQLFRANTAELLTEIRSSHMEREFEFDYCAYYSSMLADQIAGRNDSWAVRWYASTFLANRLCLYPNKSLVKNIGLDGSGRHCGAGGVPEADPAGDSIQLEAIPVRESQVGRKAFESYLKGRLNWHGRVRRWARLAGLSMQR